MNILMVGVGYVGLVTAACFAEMGHQVICLDIDEAKINNLRQGIIPIYEPGLSELVERNQTAGRLTFTSNYEQAVPQASLCFIAVPTPSHPDGSCDLSFVFQVARQLANLMDSSKIIITKSTVPVGTAQRLQQEINAILMTRGVDFSADIVSNPEFLKEGCALQDCMKPDRIVLGVTNPHSEKILRDLYATFTINHDRILVMDPLSAEMTKYAANAMLATRISFMNELSTLCERTGANINNVRIGIGSDHRIGLQFLYAGAGYGGSCFPKDLRALLALAKTYEVDLPILEAVEQINEQQKQILSQKVISFFQPDGGVQGKTIALWGLSFKPDTDDMREAASLVVIDNLLSQGATLRLYDPIAMTNAKKLFKHCNNLIFCHDEYDAATGADAIVLITEWKQFRTIDFSKIASLVKEKIVFDGRNQYQPQEMHKKGFLYFCIGIPSSSLKTPEIACI